MKDFFNVRYDKAHHRYYVRVPDRLRPLYTQGVFCDFDGKADAKAFAEQENSKYQAEISERDLTSALSIMEQCQAEFGYDGTLVQMAKEKYEALKRATKEAEDLTEDELTLEQIRTLWLDELMAST